MFPKVVCCRSVRNSCLYYMPRGVSNTLDYMHAVLSYYIGTGTKMRFAKSVFICPFLLEKIISRHRVAARFYVGCKLDKNMILLEGRTVICIKASQNVIQ